MTGTPTCPTFAPSLLKRLPEPTCHLFVRAGKLQYLSDCGHDLAGQTVEMVTRQQSDELLKAID